MEGIPIYYVMQPSTDTSLNVFFLPPTYKSQADIKIKDVITNFPHKDSGRFFHYRFYAICDKDQKTWVDISNMSAKAPVVDNRILLKVLEIEKPHYSKTFTAVSKVSREEPAVQPDNKPRPREEPMNTSQQRSNQSRPTEGQRPPTNVTSPPKSQTSQSQPQPPVNVKSPPTRANDYEDLLGDHGPTSSTQTVTQVTTKVTFASPQSAHSQHSQNDDSEITKGMTREELTAYKADKMNRAIQEKLAFANKIWADENKNNEEKFKAYDELEDSIKRWSGKNGQRNNIRALLCTLHEVTWQGCDWQPLSLSDLMVPRQIKVNYFKAITKFHPDKNQNAEYRQKYIAERVTNELNAAWDEFRKTNP